MLEDSWLSWLGPWLGGGLAGAIVTLGTQNITKWWEKPKLAAEFGKEGDGSIIKHALPASNPDSPAQVIQQWIRVKIKNNGRSTARNVRVIIVYISNKTSDFTSWDFNREIIDCGWSHIYETRIDIPPRTWRFADLFVLEMTEGSADIRFTGKGAENIPGRMEIISIGAMITADNCETTTVTLPLRYQGLGKGMTFTTTA